jgi:hypothetical protein
MQRSRLNNNKSLSTKGFAFISKYWLILIVFTIGIFPLIRFIKAQVQKGKEQNLSLSTDLNNVQNTNLTPAIEKEKTDYLRRKYPNASKEKIAEIKANALKMAIALGYTADIDGEHHLFGLDWLPIVNNSWTEDEATAVSIAKKHTGTFPILCDAYFSLYTMSRDLKKDLLNKLKKSDLDAIRKAHLQFGGYKYI